MWVPKVNNVGPSSILTNNQKINLEMPCIQSEREITQMQIVKSVLNGPQPSK